MALFGIKIADTEKVRKFMHDVENRLQNKNLVHNPFNAKVKEYPVISDKEPEMIYLIDMEPVYPNVTFIGWLMVFGVLVFRGFSLWLLPGIVITMLGIFWTAEFYYFALRLGLRKQKYKGTVERLRHEQIIKNILMRD